MKNLSVIIPAYNLEENIQENLLKVFNKIKKLNIDFEIIVINDGSTDDTLLEIQKSIINFDNIKLINQKKNLGKSLAIRAGLKKSKFNNVILIDCDIPYFQYLNKILENLDKGYDLVIVNRRLKESKLVENKISFYQKTRGIIGGIIGILINIFLKLNIKGNDTQAGLKGFKKLENFEKIKFYSKKYFLDVEIIYHYNLNKKKVFSLPVNYELPKKSNIKILSFKNFYIIYELIKIITILKVK